MAKRHRDGVNVEAGYDEWARSYDFMQNPIRDLDATAIREVLGAISAEAVLELGCGTGKNTGWLAERFAQVTALDVSAGMLEKAKHKAKSTNIEFLQHDIQKPWPLDDGRFDLVTCNLILEHIANLQPIYQEAVRILRPGGRLFLCEIHPYRQLRGGQAQYLSESGDTVLIRAYTHSLAEYINEGLASGLTILRVGEWHGEDDETPRLLSVLFGR